RHDRYRCAVRNPNGLSLDTVPIAIPGYTAVAMRDMYRYKVNLRMIISINTFGFYQADSWVTGCLSDSGSIKDRKDCDRMPTFRTFF
ncbi:MAG TPA: hypothetical protein DD390_01400, partial [Rhodospirillaceae bacterium]|nr:hypothetical protein [Rhodospirillaceae bacterium]